MLTKRQSIDRAVKRNPKDHLSVYFDDFLADALAADLTAEKAEYAQRLEQANFKDLCMEEKKNSRLSMT